MYFMNLSEGGTETLITQDHRVREGSLTVYIKQTYTPFIVLSCCVFEAALNFFHMMKRLNKNLHLKDWRVACFLSPLLIQEHESKIVRNALHRVFMCSSHGSPYKTSQLETSQPTHRANVNQLALFQPTKPAVVGRHEEPEF